MTPRLPLTVLTFASVVLAGCAAVLPAAQHHTVLPTVITRATPTHRVIFGMDFQPFGTESARARRSDLAAAKAIGITSVRIEANWAGIQPRPRVFAWRALDQQVRDILAAKLSVDIVLDSSPSWAAVPSARKDPFPQPASVTEFSKWAAKVAARYKHLGVHIFEIWNEPNDNKFWQPAPNPAAYTRMLKASYRAIKSVNPSAFIISGGFAPVVQRNGSIDAITFLKSMYAHGAHGYFNALGDHPYCFPALPNTYSPSSAWSQMSRTSISIRSLMQLYGDARKPIWITEFGAPTGGTRGVGFKGQARQFAQAIPAAKAKRWIGAFYIYTWRDLGTNRRFSGDWWGLLTPRSHRKPAYTTVASAIRKN